MESLPAPPPKEETAVADLGKELLGKEEEHSINDFRKTLEGTLNRIASSLPRDELQIIIREAMECESALLQEIRILEEAAGLPMTPIPDSHMALETDSKKIKNEELVHKSSIHLSSILPNEYNPNLNSPTNYLSNADDILATVFAPHDRYFTLSALLGRLREPLTTSPTTNSSNTAVNQQKQEGHHRRISSTVTDMNANSASTANRLLKHKLILELQTNPFYTQLYTLDQTQPLLTLWKRISNHRTALVFRKPVNPEEAPGYKERIQYPMDLSLIRKLITNGYVSSFQQLHVYLGLICHNCIKFNGRESDYASLARDFEAYVDESMLDTIQKLGAAVANPTSTSVTLVDQTDMVDDLVQRIGDTKE